MRGRYGNDSANPQIDAFGSAAAHSFVSSVGCDGGLAEPLIIVEVGKVAS